MLADAVIDCSEEYEVTRHVSVAMEKGRKADPITETLIIDAAITPITGQDMKRIGEGGFKVEGSILIITPNQLFTSKSSTCRLADHVHWQGADYQVSIVKDWSIQGGFYECVGTRIDR